jgi:putative cardiolipin synthase
VQASSALDVRRLVGIVALVLLAAGCASLPTDYPRTESRALADTGGTTLGRLAARLAGADDGKTAYLPLPQGLDAFLARSDLIDAAERSLDIQYYVIEHDLTGLRFAERLLAAADRGVRVRILLDDIGTQGRDRGLLALDAHPNIELRLFNPFALRSRRLFDFIASGGRVNRRMHNKSFNADNQLAIVGGRNSGDAYFQARSEDGFADFDLLLAGPAVRELGDAFDTYWNSEVVLPVAAVAGSPATAEELEASRTGLRAHADAMRDSPYSGGGRKASLPAALAAGSRQVFRGKAAIHFDLPRKVTDAMDNRVAHLGPQLRPIVEAARSEVLVANPYFVPRSDGVEFFAAVRAQGARVSVLTNSLASTDVPAVHSGYQRYREDLLRAGLELYELRPRSAETARLVQRDGPRPPDHLGLHAKFFAVDRRFLFVGSMNLDPRSGRINTEMGVLIDDPAGVASLAEEFRRSLPNAAYRVALENLDGRERLVWTEKTADGERRHFDEPDASAWLKFKVFLLSILPVEDQL